MGAVLGVAVALLELAGELVGVALDLVEVIVGQLAPLHLRFTFDLLPLALEDVRIHVALLLSCAGAEAPTYFASRFNVSRQEATIAGASPSFLPLRTPLTSSTPYIARFESLSACSAAPSSVAPTNRPLAREYARICALTCALVAAVALRPTGPAAAAISPRSVKRSCSSCSRPFLFMTSSTRSTDSAPICQPMLPPLMLMNAGADHWFAARSRLLITPLPCLPPMTKPPLIRFGMTTMASARSSRYCGMPSSGADVN